MRLQTKHAVHCVHVPWDPFMDFAENRVLCIQIPALISCANQPELTTSMLTDHTSMGSLMKPYSDGKLVAKLAILCNGTRNLIGIVFFSQYWACPHLDSGFQVDCQPFSGSNRCTSFGGNSKLHTCASSNQKKADKQPEIQYTASSVGCFTCWGGKKAVRSLQEAFLWCWLLMVSTSNNKHWKFA